MTKIAAVLRAHRTTRRNISQCNSNQRSDRGNNHRRRMRSRDLASLISVEVGNICQRDTKRHLPAMTRGANRVDSEQAGQGYGQLHMGRTTVVWFAGGERCQRREKRVLGLPKPPRNCLGARSRPRQPSASQEARSPSVHRSAAGQGEAKCR